MNCASIDEVHSPIVVGESLVVKGSAKVLITAIGNFSACGKIKEMIQAIDGEPSSL